MSSKVEASPQTVSTLLLVVSAVIAVVTSPLFGGISFGGLSSHWLPISIVVASTAIGNAIYFTGIQHLESSVTQIAFASIVVRLLALPTS